MYLKVRSLYMTLREAATAGRSMFELSEYSPTRDKTSNTRNPTSIVLMTPPTIKGLPGSILHRPLSKLLLRQVKPQVGNLMFIYGNQPVHELSSIAAGKQVARAISRLN